MIEWLDYGPLWLAAIVLVGILVAVRYERRTREASEQLAHDSEVAELLYPRTGRVEVEPRKPPMEGRT